MKTTLLQKTLKQKDTVRMKNSAEKSFYQALEKEY